MTAASTDVLLERIRAFQRYLKANGFDPGDIDGLPGKKTRKAADALWAARAVDLHPKLRRVLDRARQMAGDADPIMILEGVRTDEQAYVNFGKGRTAAQCAAAGCPEKHAQPKLAKVTFLANPLNTKHRRQRDGFGYAADLLSFPIDWIALPRFDRVAALVFAAADAEKVKIRWGADWDQDGKPRERGESDSPHFELAA